MIVAMIVTVKPVEMANLTTRWLIGNNTKKDFTEINFIDKIYLIKILAT